MHALNLWGMLPNVASKSSSTLAPPSDEDAAQAATSTQVGSTKQIQSQADSAHAAQPVAKKELP